jgi:hypothetical protein
MNRKEMCNKVMLSLFVIAISSILIPNFNVDEFVKYHAFAQTINGTYEGPIPENNSTIDNNPLDFGNGPISEDNMTSPNQNSGMSSDNSTQNNPENIGNLPDQSALQNENATIQQNNGTVMPNPTITTNGTGNEDLKTAMQNSEQIIQQLEQESSQLPKSFQSLLSDLQSGQYYGPTLGGDSSTSHYSVTLTGSAVSKSNSSATNFSGKIFVENIKTGNDAIKYKVTGGHVSIGNTSYDIAFGKARVISNSQASLDSMTLIAHATDNNGSPYTIHMLIQTASSLEGNYGSSPIQIIIQTPYSMMNNDISLSGSGQLSLIAP